MVTAIRQKAIVGKDGKIELPQTELAEGTSVEVIVLAEEKENSNPLETLIRKSSLRHMKEDEVNTIAVQVVRELRANQ
jgi:hypothetical protein